MQQHATRGDGTTAGGRTGDATTCRSRARAIVQEQDQDEEQDEVEDEDEDQDKIKGRQDQGQEPEPEQEQEGSRIITRDNGTRVQRGGVGRADDQ